MAAAIEAATALSKTWYKMGMLRSLVSLKTDGLFNIWGGRAGSYVTGMDGAQFATRLGLPGSFGTTGEQDTLTGKGTNETVSRTTYRRIRLQIIQQYGVIELTQASRYLSGEERMQEDIFAEEVANHIEFAAMHWYYTFHHGASGFLVRCSSTAPVVVSGTTVANTTWTITIDTTVQAGSDRYAQNAWPIVPGTRVQIVNNSTHAVITSGGNEYKGEVISVGENGTSVVVQFDTAMASTASDVTNTHVIRLQRGSGKQEKYGLYDLVGNTGSLYVPGGSTTPTAVWPYASNETSLNPATLGEWASIIFNTESPGSTSVNDCDRAYELLQNRWGVSPETNQIVFLGTPGVCKSLYQEQRAQKRYMTGDKNDQTNMGRRCFDNGVPIYESRFLPKGVSYLLNSDVLCQDVLEKQGPAWSADPGLDGQDTGAVFTRSTTSPVFQALSYWFGQRATETRGEHVKMRGGES